MVQKIGGCMVFVLGNSRSSIYNKDEGFSDDPYHPLL